MNHLLITALGVVSGRMVITGLAGLVWLLEDAVVRYYGDAVTCRPSDLPLCARAWTRPSTATTS
jgi:hypothetical protein